MAPVRRLRTKAMHVTSLLLTGLVVLAVGFRLVQLARPSEPPRRGRVAVRYTMLGGGLTNQLNAHINALTLAHAMGADALLMPHAFSRPHLNHTRETAGWRAEPLSTLLDVPAMREAWAQRGLRLIEQADSSGALDSWRRCANATLDHSRGHKPVKGQAELRAPLGTVASLALQAVAGAWQRHGLQACVVLDAQSLFFTVQTNSTGNLTAWAAESLRFPPRLEQLAGRVASALGGPFNGVHLRLEPDFRLRFRAALERYVGAMRGAGFTAQAPLYVASGMLGYNDTAGFDAVVQRLRKEGLAGTVVAKEHILSAQEDLQGLHSEQLALIDLLVLTRAARLVGYDLSTFSYAARDLRALRAGGSRDSCVLVEHAAGGHQGWEGLASFHRAP